MGGHQPLLVSFDLETRQEIQQVVEFIVTVSREILKDKHVATMFPYCFTTVNVAVGTTTCHVTYRFISLKCHCTFDESFCQA